MLRLNWRASVRWAQSAGGVLLAAAAACGGGDSSGPPVVHTPYVTIVAPTSVAVGATVELRASVIPHGPISWSVSPTTVATISTDGKLTGVAPGAAQATATSGSASATTTVDVLPPFIDLALGGRHACARSADNGLYCWGDNAVAALGRSSPEICPVQQRQCSTSPRSLVDSPTFVQVAGGGSGTSCGLTTTGLAYCWGNNEFDWIGQTADSCTVEGVGTSACSRTPAAVPGGVIFASIVLGGAFACGLTPFGAAYCWGDNDEGQLGTTSTESCAGTPCNRTPSEVRGGLTFTSLAAGNQHACGIVASGAAYCWGRNTVGQLGSAGTGGPDPAPVSGGHLFTMLSASFNHTCGVSTTGAAYCWGDNTFGRLGDGTTTASLEPKLVAGGLQFISVTAALEHSCGLVTSGAAYCWGQNTGLQVQGQLGTGNTTPSLVPGLVAGNHSFVQLIAGRQFTCGRTQVGFVYCWGDNRFGQLGIGNSSVLVSTRPVGVAGAP